MSFYDKLRQKNLQEKQEMMRELGMIIPSCEPIRSKPASPVPAKRGRPFKKLPACEVSDYEEDYEVDEDEQDDEEWENGPSKKKRKREKRAPAETTESYNNSTMAVKTTREKKKDRYPKRDNVRPKYEDDYNPGSDDMLYCADCKCEWEGDCLEHGPLLVIEDTKVPPDINDKSRAKKTAPSIITVADSKIPEAGSGVWARDYIPARVRFGPYDGKRVSHDVRNPYTWVIRKNGKPHFCVDATEPGLSNWMRFVNCARYDGEQNLEAFQYCGSIYYRTLRRISPHEELLVWYGDDYGRQLGIDPEICDAEDEEKWREMRFKCPGCEFSYTSPLYLERHKRVCRSLKAVEKPGQTYQCHGCKFLYSDADYLKRHSRFCRKLQVTAYGLTEKCYTKAETERSGFHRKESLESAKVKHDSDKDADLPVEDKGRVSTRSGSRASSSLSVDQISEYSEISQETKESASMKFKHSICIQPEVAAVIQPESLGEDKPDTSAEIAPRISSDIESAVSDDTRPGYPSEVMSEVSISSSTGERSDLSKIQQAYVRLERIPWFSDARAAEKPYLCADCNERFGGKNDLDSHVSQHRLNTLFVCPVTKCNKTFCAEDRVWQHFAVHFDGEPVAPIDAPSEKSPESTHGDVPIGLKCFVCRKCYQFFRGKENLLNHRCIEPRIDTGSEKALSECTTVEIPNEEKSHTCFECKESFKSSQHLTLHQVTHRAGCRFAGKLQGKLAWSASQDLQSCLMNGETAFLSERIGQISLSHTLTTAVLVQLGQELFSTESSIPLTNKNSAEVEVHPITVKKKSGRINTQLGISASLKNYLSSPRGAFVCSKCNSKFSQKSTLIVHRRTHNVKKTFYCKLCKKGFFLSGSFQRHTLVHESEL